MQNRITLILAGIVYLFTSSQTVFAQNDLNKKIDNIDGTVDKITITSEGNEYTFEGADAEKLFKKMKNNQVQSFTWNLADDSIHKVIILDADGDEQEIEVESGDENVFIIKTDKDLDDIDEGMTKKVKVEIKDGNEKVTLITKENGEEKTEVYEGDEADEYIEEMKSENIDLNISVDEEKDGKKVNKIIIETEKNVN